MTAPPDPLPPIGAEAPPFRLPDLNGHAVALVDLLALGPVWLVFYKAACPTCSMAVPYLRRLSEAVPHLDGSVVLIAQDDRDTARAFAAEHGLTGPILLDANPWPVSAAYGLRAVPSHVFIEMSGVVAAAGEGFVRHEWETQTRNLAARSGAPDFRLFHEGDPIPALRPG